MPYEPVSAPWRRMRVAGLLLFGVCAVLLPLFLHALQHGWLDRHLNGGDPRDMIRLGLPKLLWLGLVGGGMSALLASWMLRRAPPR